MLVWSLYNVVSSLFNLYEIIIVVWCVLSWIPKHPGGVLFDVAGAIDRLVAPYINLFRRFIPAFGGIDFSPVIAILALSLIEMIVLTLIRILFGWLP